MSPYYPPPAAGGGGGIATVSAFPPASYVFTSGGAGVGASTLGAVVGQFRASPFFVPVSTTFQGIGLETTIVGDVGSLIRLGIYGDTNGLPNALVLDAGTINGNAVAVQEIASAFTLAAGAYWIGSTPQVVTTTFPTCRIITAPNPNQYAGTVAPGSATLVGVLSTSTITGALPATFPLGGGAGSVGRIFLHTL